MRRRLIQLGLFVLGGAVVNVAVAWGCAIFIAAHTEDLRLQSYPLKERLGGGLFWEVWTIGGAGCQRVDSRCVSMHGFILSRPSGDGSIERKRPKLMPQLPRWWSGPREPPKDWENWHECRIALASGWPRLSQSVEFALVDKEFRTSLRLGGFEVAEAKRDPSLQPYFDHPVALPLRPIWPGFAINTLFYAAILWAMFAAPFALRRRRRVKRGLCPVCAYPVGESDLCTECGAVVRPRPELAPR